MADFVPVVVVGGIDPAKSLAKCRKPPDARGGPSRSAGRLFSGIRRKGRDYEEIADVSLPQV
jgi:hypothetical protein